MLLDSIRWEALNLTGWPAWRRANFLEDTGAAVSVAADAQRRHRAHHRPNLGEGYDGGDFFLDRITAVENAITAVKAVTAYDGSI